MITNEQKLVYILTNPELVNWSKEVWDDAWENYLVDCDDMAEDNDCPAEEIMEEWSFLDWYEDGQEDQVYTWEMVKTLRD